MVKKKSSLQNIIIIILSILLLISIAVGVTYAYQNNKKTVIKGNIYTANLSINLGTNDSSGHSSELWIEGVANKTFIPGDTLPNVKLNITNSSSHPVYIAILFSLSVGNDQITNVPAVNFLSYNTDDWRKVTYVIDEDTQYACLVGYNSFDVTHSKHGEPVEIVGERSLQIPFEWGNELKGKQVTISIAAYAIQAQLEDKFADPIKNAGTDERRAEEIAKAVFKISGLDKT